MALEPAGIPRLHRVFAEVGRDLFLSGLVGSHSGNMSVRLGDRVVMTRHGCRLGRLRRADLLEFRLDGGRIPEGASSEAELHVTVYSESDHAAVLHSHPPNAVALSILEPGDGPKPISFEAAHYMPRVRIVDPRAGAHITARARTWIGCRMLTTPSNHFPIRKQDT